MSGQSGSGQRLIMSSPDMFASEDSPSSQSFDRAALSSFASSPTPPTPSQYALTPTPPSLTSTPLESQELDYAGNICCRINIDFFDSKGRKIKSQSSSNQEVISIVSSMVKSNSSEDYRRSTVNKICQSEMFKVLIGEKVLQNLSHQFQNFLAKKNCPLKACDKLSSPDIASETDFENLLNQSFEECPNVVNALSIISSGYSNGYRQSLLEPNNKYQKQRLLALLAICAFTRNQKVNFYQKIIGEFLKRRNTSKHCLQFLHRVGLSLVTMSIRSDQQKMGINFLKEVKDRKAEIEVWAFQKQVLEEAIKAEKILSSNIRISSSQSKFQVIFVADDEAEIIDDLGDLLHTVVSKDEQFVEFMKAVHGSAAESMEAHLDMRPKLYDLSYDNIGKDIS